VSLVILFAVTALVFLLGDAVMLPTVLRPLFQQHLGAQLLDGIRLAPAVLFYLSYAGGLVYFAGMPALRDGSALTALTNGALLGLVAFGCYELTSHAIMRDWHVSIVVTDMAWGIFISGLSAWLAALAALKYLAR
jgi:uncharacterized membrane protein